MRKLASIQRIAALKPIEGADKIEVAQILGWEVVVRKNEFKIGDLVVYIEIDSIVPDKPEFAFLADRKFRVRTIRLRKQVSQGIAFPLSILPVNEKYQEDDDVTDVLGIIKYDPQAAEEAKAADNAKSKSKVLRFCMRFSLFRWLYSKITSKDKRWPSWIQKTDEDRVQICGRLLKEHGHCLFYITEKLDGQSATYFTVKNRIWGMRRLVFGLCSRNIRLRKRDTSTYWQIESKYDIGNKMLKINKHKFVIQGEIVGGKVQGNKYKLPELDFFVFNVIEDGKRYDLSKLVEFCNSHGFKYVPIRQYYQALPLLANAELDDDFIDIPALINMSVNRSKLNPEVWQEGLVFRRCDNGAVSFKVINPEFLLAHEE